MLNPKDYPEVVKTFLEIVPIYNPSKHEDELVLWLVDKLTAIGVKSIVQDDFGNVIAKIDSNIPDNDKSIMFITHLDSVRPCNGISVKIEDTKSDYIIKPKSNTILSADDKAGISAIIEAVRIIKNNKIERPNIELVFTVQEEIGLLGAKALDYSQFKSKIAFSVDAEGPVGSIITQGPTQKQFLMDFYGKSAHAGMSPEKGINSICVAADFLNNATIGRIDHATTSNIGLMKGGIATNIIPELTSLKGEVRSLFESKIDGIIGSYKLAAQKSVEKFPGARYEFVDKFTYHSFLIDTNNAGVKLAVRACNNSNINPIITSIGSGSDANIFNSNDIDTLILGAGFQNSHSLDESISFSQLSLLCTLIINIIEEALY